MKLNAKEEGITDEAITAKTRAIQSIARIAIDKFPKAKQNQIEGLL